MRRSVSGGILREHIETRTLYVLGQSHHLVFTTREWRTDPAICVIGTIATRGW